MTSENPNPEPEPPPPNPRQEFLEGPTPLWIWGANNDVNYNLRKTFTANAKSAKLFISCDNAGTVSINGQQVAADVPWDSPKVVDVTKQLKAGQNEIVAHVVNLDGVAAFLCKLMLTTADGTTEYVVSDDTWTATEDGKENANALAVSVRGRLGDAPWHNVIQGEPSEADPVRGMFHGLPGFQVERLYTVPRDEQGSWVAMTVDDRGRIIVSDQGDKGLYRVTPSPIGSQEPTLVEKIPVDITSAQGLLCAFDSLYVSVNGGPGSGLYRVRDTNSDDQYDEVKKLAELRGGGRPMVSPSTSSAAITRCRPRRSTPAGCRRTGRKTCCCLACGTPTGTPEEFSRRAAGSRRPIPKAKRGRLSPAAIAIPMTWTSTPTANCSSMTPTWNGTWDRPGIGRRA
jgi:hypothetical protein